MCEAWLQAGKCDPHEGSKAMACSVCGQPLCRVRAGGQYRSQPKRRLDRDISVCVALLFVLWKGPQKADAASDCRSARARQGQARRPIPVQALQPHPGTKVTRPLPSRDAHEVFFVRPWPFTSCRLPHAFPSSSSRTANAANATQGPRNAPHAQPGKDPYFEENPSRKRKCAKSSRTAAGGGAGGSGAPSAAEAPHD
jgi:hypothetical protein